MYLYILKASKKQLNGGAPALALFNSNQTHKRFGSDSKC